MLALIMLQETCSLLEMMEHLKLLNFDYLEIDIIYSFILFPHFIS